MRNLTMKLWQCWYVIRKIIWDIPTPFHTCRLDNLPDEVKGNHIYLIGENGTFWIVALNCPCGYGTVIQLNLLPEVKPRWKLKARSDSTVSLSLHRSFCNGNFKSVKCIIAFAYF